MGGGAARIGLRKRSGQRARSPASLRPCSCIHGRSPLVHPQPQPVQPWSSTARWLRISTLADALPFWLCLRAFVRACFCLPASLLSLLQMLENWCYETEPLLLMSGHVSDSSQKMPAELMQSIIDSKKANAGIFNKRQCILGLFDQVTGTARRAHNESMHRQQRRFQPAEGGTARRRRTNDIRRSGKANDVRRARAPCWCLLRIALPFAIWTLDPTPS